MERKFQSFHQPPFGHRLSRSTYQTTIGYPLCCVLESDGLRWTSIPNLNRHQMLGRHLCYHYTNAGYQWRVVYYACTPLAWAPCFSPRRAWLLQPKWQMSICLAWKLSNPLGTFSRTNVFAHLNAGRRGRTWTYNRIKHLIYSQGWYQLHCTLRYNVGFSRHRITNNRPTSTLEQTGLLLKSLDDSADCPINLLSLFKVVRAYDTPIRAITVGSLLCSVQFFKATLFCFWWPYPASIRVFSLERAVY